MVATSLPFTADNTLQAVAWSALDDLSSLSAQGPLRFRFTLTSGELYSFWVSPNANGASNGYVARAVPASLRMSIPSEPHHCPHDDEQLAR